MVVSRLNQTQAGARIGVAASRLSEWLAGRRPPSEDRQREIVFLLTAPQDQRVAYMFKQLQGDVAGRIEQFRVALQTATAEERTAIVIATDDLDRASDAEGEPRPQQRMAQ